MVGSSALRDITNLVADSALQGTASDEPVEGKTTLLPEDAIQAKTRLAIEKMQKELSDEAVRHITRAKVMYKPRIRVSLISVPVAVSPNPGSSIIQH